jgi:hypothetical protein
MAREQAKRNCELMDTPTALSNIGTSAANGEAHPTGHPANNTEIINIAGQIDTTPLFGSSGQCPVDVVVNQYVTLPFSNLCPYLEMLGAAWVAACMLGAGYIIFNRG